MGCACVSVWPDKYLCSLVQSKMSALLLLSSRDDEALMRSFVIIHMLVGRFVCRMICLTNCPQICLLALLLVISWQKFITFIFYQHIRVCFPLLPFLHVSCHYEH